MKADPAPIFTSTDELAARVASAGARSVVLANGCFDPLHVGHLRYLVGAAGHGDFLVVAVHDDASTRDLKGAGRPVLAQADRAQLIAGVGVVNAVLIFGERNVESILERLRPAFHANGTDYTVETVPEIATARRLGIETVIAGDGKDHASRDVVRRIERGKTGEAK